MSDHGTRPTAGVRPRSPRRWGAELVVVCAVLAGAAGVAAGLREPARASAVAEGTQPRTAPLEQASALEPPVSPPEPQTPSPAPPELAAPPLYLTAAVPGADPGDRKAWTAEEWLAHGPREPLVPRVVHVEATPAPRGPVTAEPLEPRVVVLTDAKGPPREGARPPTDEPLVPRVVRLDGALPADDAGGEE